MPAIIEGSLRFEFPDDWCASKFDDWSYYRNQFARIGDAEIACRKEDCLGIAHCSVCGSKRMAGTRGVDILAVDPDSTCWLIEIKDYRRTRVTNFAFLADTVALKVRDTLACLVSARFHATGDQEQDHARRALDCSQTRILLHLESPPTHSAQQTSMAQRALVLQRLKQLVKPVDPRPRVVSGAHMDNLPWSVTEV